MNLGIEGRTAIVCASSQGLGLACAQALAQEGVHVLINGRDQAKVDKTAAALREVARGDVIAIAADVTTTDGQAKLIAACPSPDILVNNNAGPAPGNFADVERDRWLKAIEANMIAPLMLVRAVLPAMKQRRFGRIVNITSAMVTTPRPHMTVSSGARAGLTAAIKGLSLEVAPYNVTTQQRYEQYQDYAKRWNNEFYRSYTYEKAFADLRAVRLAVYPNNAHADRGILGLATRAEGTFAVQMVRTYMRDHYTRTAQVKALTEYLSGNPSPAALQMLLSIARRHRTNAVQVLAQALVERIADERGWTTDELADRTIPTAGLDERGILDLEIGSRPYQARLDAEDVLTLYNPDGKVVKNMPQVSEGPDKESAAEAKKALSNAKKELKQVHEFQAKRLYEALCIGRRWQLAEWRRFLLEHPIVGRLVQRLVWLGLDAQGEIVGSFRPLEDLSLTDSSDNAVDLASFTAVRLAHGSLFTGEQSEAWKQHLADYKIEPLFNQLDRPVLASAAGASIDDRTGYIIEAFKLRSAAQKLGYERAQAEDGGWFTQYIKSFTGIGINAVIEFTGSPLPEENRAVALLETKFVRARKGQRSGYGAQIALNEVPSVLLSEVWNDLHQIAGVGIGFAADWRNKVAW